MNLVRQNSDYALRFLVNLAQRSPDERASARTLADQEEVSYQFTCKILQRLHEAGFVESTMGPKGGYALSRSPSDISLAEVLAAIQGPLAVNTCMLSFEACHRRPHCPISRRLEVLQERINVFFHHTSLANLVSEHSTSTEQHVHSTETLKP